LSLARDWRQVLALIENAFGDELDAESRRTLYHMRLPPVLAPVIGVLDSLAPPGESMMPGFVWVEGGQVIGAVSARRIHPYNQGWLISNVAVHPDRQGRGIGRALLETALDFAQDRGGAWVVLQVRNNNATARQLYASLGFQQIGEIARLRSAAIWPVSSPALTGQLFPAGWSDGSTLLRLARTLTPQDVLWADVMNRKLYQTDPWSRLMARLQGHRCQWWIQGMAGTAPKAAVGIKVDPQLPWRRLYLLIPPQAQNQQLAAELVAFGLAQLSDAPRAPIEIEYPLSDTATQAALAEAGFAQVFTLLHMRLELA